MKQRPLHIRIIAPSGVVDTTAIQQAQIALQQRDYQISFGKNLFAQHRYFAGTVQQRIEDLVAAYHDPNIDAIWCARGGSGSAQLLPYLDQFNLLSSFKQKPLIGYSDNCCLLNYIQQRHGLAMHACVFQEITQKNIVLQHHQADENHLAISQNAIQVLDLIQSPLQKKYYDLKAIYAPSSQPIQGQLIGGNLTTLASLQGTRWALTLDHPSILILEDIGESFYRLERSWIQLLQSVQMKHLKAVVLADFDQCSSHTVNVELADIFAEHLYDANIALYQCHYFGHGIDNQPFYLGRMAHIQDQQLIL